MAVIGIAGTVGVFVAMLSLARGFPRDIGGLRFAGNALVMRAGSTSEMMGGVTLDSVKIIQDAPGIARRVGGPLVTQEVVGVIPFPLISDRHQRECAGSRSLGQMSLRIRTSSKSRRDRCFNPGLNELIVGKNTEHHVSRFDDRKHGRVWRHSLEGCRPVLTPAAPHSIRKSGAMGQSSIRSATSGGHLSIRRPFILLSPDYATNSSRMRSMADPRHERRRRRARSTTTPNSRPR